MPYTNWKPTRFIEVDGNAIHLLINEVRYGDNHYNLIKAYTELHTEYTKLFDAYFDAQQEIHTLLLENKALRDDNDNR